MFVAAACGVPVVKHGNRGITSKCGGADVLEALGVRIDAPPAPALAAAGCCFLFAPLYHPAFKAIAPVRQALAAQGRASVFNLLGPLLNPASPDFQLAGVFHPGLPAIYAEVYRLLGRKNAWVVHGAGGLDEVAVHGPTRVLAVGPDGTTEFSIKPQELGITATGLKELRGGTAQENAALIENLLSGRDRSARREIVALNAACALVVAGRSPDLPAALALARQALDEGSAQDTLERLRRAA